MDSKKISVNTPFGILVAEASIVPEFPEIHIYLTREDGIEIDLGIIGCDLITASDKISAYIYTDITDNNWPVKHDWTREELEAEID